MKESSTNKDYCFGTLAIGKLHQNLAKQLALDLENNSPKTTFIILTDDPSVFSDFKNVLAIKHIQERPLLVLNDKRRVIERGLEKFSSVIFIDADCRIVKSLSENISWPPGITVNHDTQRSFGENFRKHCSSDQGIYEQLFKKIQLVISLDQCKFPIPNLFVITKDNGREKTFLEYWDKIARYCEINRCKNVFEAYSIGLAMCCTGWNATSFNEEFLDFYKSINHIGTYKKTKKQPQTFIDKQKIRYLYYYRWVKVCLSGLKDFGFYFR
ncbi:MAG: hypothetical protein RIM23_25745 [Coleofasciculus sp. G3-WIS-01]|uniref:hypothetical protein n=1 Tax=Coleofasciculus sp. G3-WIS-01 TaxID=3069528 RepID=UPI003300F8ED